MKNNLDKIFSEIEESREDLVDKSEILPLFSSEFQLANFSLSKGAINEFGLFKKTKLELQGRLDMLQSLYFSYEGLKIDIDEINEALENEDNKFSVRRLQLSLKEKEAALFNIERSVSNLNQEYGMMRDVFLKLYDKFKDSDINSLEIEYWIEKYRLDVSKLLKEGKVQELGDLLSSFDSGFAEKIVEGVPGLTSERISREVGNAE